MAKAPKAREFAYRGKPATPPRERQSSMKIPPFGKPTPDRRQHVKTLPDTGKQALKGAPGKITLAGSKPLMPPEKGSRAKRFT